MRNWFITFVLAAATLFAAPAQIIILRHAEKDPISSQLVDPQGLERAAALAYYLTQTPYLLNHGPIAAVFASRQIDQQDRIIPRTIETMMPVAEYLQLPVHSPFNGFQTAEMVNFIMNNPKYDGKNIVICWNHTSIIDLLHAFGFSWPLATGTPPYPAADAFYPNCRFDMIFVLTFPQTSMYPALYFQQLMYADATCSGGTPPCVNPNCPNTSCSNSLPPQTCPSYTPPPSCGACGP